MYPIRTEKSFRLDDSGDFHWETHKPTENHILEINFIAEPNVKIDGNIFHTIRIGYNGYLGGTNSQKDYRIIPILLMNYDLSADGGLVHYTEKFNKHYKQGFH